MKKLVFSLFFLAMSMSLYSQPHKAKERISMLKKIKLIEVLDLDEKESDKLIVKYSAWENKIEEQMKNFDDAEDDLRKAIKSDKLENIKKQSDNFIKARANILKIADDRDKDMKSILTEVQFAKYLIFEKKFRKELGEQIMKKRRNRESRRQD